MSDRGIGLRLLVTGGLVAGACALAASGASAGPATYYASASSTDTTGTCTSAAPCRLDHAIALAAAGDVVVVLPGTYSINYELSTSLPITIEGQPGQPRPSLVANPQMNNDTLSVSGGAVVRHLEIVTNNDQGTPTAALSIDGGTGEDLVLVAGSEDEGGEALSALDSSTGTIIRTVLAVNKAEGGEAVSFKDDNPSPGTANAYNLTAIATGEDGEALSGNVATGTVWVKDSIADGQGSDISTKPGTNALNLTYSAFRSAHSSGYIDRGGNILAAPVFVGASSGNYREAETSSTIDAGANDAALTATDLDGNPRVIGSAPDIGAYEYTGSSAGNTNGGGSTAIGSSDGTPTTLPAAGAPVPGVSVALHPVSGAVQVQLPGSRRFIRLARAATVPVGSVIDVTHGEVTLTSAVNLHGGNKTGSFRSGRFVLTQSTGSRPSTNLRLVGGSFAGCSASAGATSDGQPLAGIARRRPRRRVVRQLWGSDNGGSFVTIGNTASAAVRGTVWLTQDRCDGTLVRVLRGAVLVHDDVRGRNVLIHRGHAYLARARG